MPKRCFWHISIVSVMGALGVLSAQNTSAELQGTIHDVTGALIPRATISIRNAATGATRSAISDSAGIFNLPDLQPSHYEMTVSARGFATQHVTNLGLDVSDQQLLNITLTPAAIETTVEVKADAAGIDLARNGLTGVEGTRAIRELPLNGRDWTQLALLQPGVSAIRTQNALNGSSSNRGSRGFGSAVSIGGGRPTQNNYFLDGISQNDYTNGAPGSVLGLALGADGIQEFSVLTNNYNATYGGASGGVVNAVSRSGTNVVHGDAYEFLRNDKLDARNFFDGPKPPFRRNQFGAAVGGPIRRDKAFFFINYEGLKQVLSSTSIATVPSVAARAGNLSTGKIHVSPTIVPYLALWPLPNGPLLGAGDTGQYIFTAKGPASEDFGLVKYDHSLSVEDSLAISWSTDNGRTMSPDGLNTIFVDNRLWRNTVALNETHIFNPRLVGIFRVGMNRAAAKGLSTSAGNNPAASDPDLGVLPGRYAPVLNVPGITKFTGGNNGLATTNFWFTNMQFYGDLSIQKGRHLIKTGAEFIRYRYNTQVSSDPNGEYDFLSVNDFLTNNRLALFYADVFYSGDQAMPTATGFPERGFRQNVAGAYFQDDVRLKPNLTLNLGLRYETASVPTEVNGLTSNLRDIYSTNLNVGKPLFRNPTWRNFEPRLGLAWDPFKNGKSSVRAGFGIFDVLPLIYEFGMIEAYSGPFSSLVTLVNPPAGSFPDGGYKAILNLNASSTPVRAPSIEYEPRRNYVMQWNASVQRLLTPNLTLLIAYAGSRGVHMFSVFNDADIVVPTHTAEGYLFPSPVGSGTRLNPNFGSIRQLTWGDSSSYNSLQFRLQKEFSHGLQVQGSFTWQKSIDGYSSSVFPTQFQNSVSTLFINRHLNRGPSDFNVGRIAVLDGLWELPKLANLPPVLRALTNGWEIGGIFTVSDGLPFTPLISGDAAGVNSASPYDVPDRVVGPACTHVTNPGNPSQYINLSCYTFPLPANRLGNAGRNSLIGPGLVELDGSVHRNFPMRLISEMARLQFRSEIFNLANRTNFEPPLPNNALYNSKGARLATAGIITSTATTCRQIQLALRLDW
jgi:Carboxypeptidase regulatory-like domain/TonB dependent receptor/TonB-dependent Receptor Plug Domain